MTAGVSKMPYRTFLPYDILGGFLWTWTMLILGYYLGQIDFIANNIEFIALGIVILSVIPIYTHLLRERRKAAPTPPAPQQPGGGES